VKKSPLFIGIAFIASIGVGLCLAALNVKYRDFRYIVQFSLYISPVGFSSSVVFERFPQWGWIYSLNPSTIKISIKKASNSLIFKFSQTISRAFNQLELIVDALNTTTCSSVVLRKQ
jgi:ABC-type polysaccharide/polyol phosphate export permease